MMQSKDINIIFLDYDGVINIDREDISPYFENPEAIYYINKLCKEFDLKIVVSSSWRRHPKYKEMLYEQGLDSSIEILGGTPNSFRGREFEIKDYLLEHKNINKFLIIDDADFSNDLKDHLVHTEFNKGFNKEKYLEALERFNNQ